MHQTIVYLLKYQPQPVGCYRILLSLDFVGHLLFPVSATPYFQSLEPFLKNIYSVSWEGEFNRSVLAQFITKFVAIESLLIKVVFSKIICYTTNQHKVFFFIYLYHDDKEKLNFC